MSSSVARALLVALVLGVAALAPARASAGAWVLPAKRAWGQVSLFHQATEERYFLDGERIPYFFEGRNQTSGLFLDLRYGVLGRLELVLQAPVYRLAFDDLADSRRSTGIADVRAGARVAILNGTNVLTAGVAVKFPTGEFVNDAEVVPVGGLTVAWSSKSPRSERRSSPISCAVRYRLPGSRCNARNTMRSSACGHALRIWRGGTISSGSSAGGRPVTAK